MEDFAIFVINNQYHVAFIDILYLMSISVDFVNVNDIMCKMEFINPNMFNNENLHNWKFLVTFVI